MKNLYNEDNRQIHNINLSNISNDYTLNIFTDASMRKVGRDTLASCYGAIAVYKDSIIDESFRVNSCCTVPAAECRGVRLALSLANKYKGQYKVINIFCDSQITVFALRDWINSIWYYNPANCKYYTASNTLVKNQELYMECNYYISELRKYVILNLFHINGHVDSSMRSIKNSIKTFKDSNGINGTIDYSFIRYLSLYNDYVDNKSRSIIKRTNVIDNNYRDAVHFFRLPNGYYGNTANVFI